MTTSGVESGARVRARCGTLRLEHVQMGCDRVALEAVHARPHFGFVLQGSFVVRNVRSEHEVMAGKLRFSAHAESLQLVIPGKFAALVGELGAAGAPAPRSAACITADSPAIGLLRCVANDPTHPALVEIERWALAERCRADQPGGATAWAEDLVLELGAAPLGSRLVRTWSEHAGRHRSTLHRSFRRSLGLDPSSWILRERLRRAWVLLESEQSLVEIAIDCGFADQSHMSRVFRRFTGWTPAALRAERRRAAARMRPGSKTARIL